MRKNVSYEFPENPLSCSLEAVDEAFYYMANHKHIFLWYKTVTSSPNIGPYSFFHEEHHCKCGAVKHVSYSNKL